MNNLTKQEMTLIKEAIEIHNDQNPENPIKIVVKETDSHAFVISVKMLMLCVMMIFVSCEVPEDVKEEVKDHFADKTVDEEVIEPFVSDYFMDTMDQYFKNGVEITVRNTNEPYDELTIELQKADYELVIAYLDDIECDVAGEPTVEGNVDFGIGNCYGTEFHWDGFLNLQGLMHNDTYYEIISQ